MILNLAETPLNLFLDIATLKLKVKRYEKYDFDFYGLI